MNPRIFIGYVSGPPFVVCWFDIKPAGTVESLPSIAEAKQQLVDAIMGEATGAL